MRRTALSTAILAAVLATAGTASASAARLYLLRGQAIVSMDPAHPGPATTVVAHAGVAVEGISAGGGYVFWVSLSRDDQRDGQLWRARADGTQAKVIVAHINSEAKTAVAGRYVFWIDPTGLSRVGIDGTDVRRRLVPLPKNDAGQSADDVAGDARWVYFSRCDDGAVGRVATDGNHLARRFVYAGKRSCPEGLGVGNGHLYWASAVSEHGDLIPALGRATTSGHAIRNDWLHTGGDFSPLDVAAGGGRIFWTSSLSSAKSGATSYLGRARADGSGIVPRLFRDDAAFSLALAP